MLMRSRAYFSNLTDMMVHVTQTLCSRDATNYGINVLAPKFFHGKKPDLVVAGTNIGSRSTRYSRSHPS
jgi:hypothetical protein